MRKQNKLSHCRKAVAFLRFLTEIIRLTNPDLKLFVKGYNVE